MKTKPHKFKWEFPEAHARVRWAAEKQDKTLRELAQLMGIHEGSFNNLLKRSMTTRNLTKLAELLEVQPGWFWTPESDFEKTYEDFRL